MGSPAFAHIHVDDAGGVLEVRLRDRHILDEGEIRTIGEEIDRALAQSDSTRVVMDFSDVEHLSSSALGLLITLNSRLQDAGGGLCLVHIAAPIGEVFRITRLDQVLSIQPDMSSGRSAVGGDA